MHQQDKELKYRTRQARRKTQNQKTVFAYFKNMPTVKEAKSAVSFFMQNRSIVHFNNVKMYEAQITQNHFQTNHLSVGQHDRRDVNV